MVRHSLRATLTSEKGDCEREVNSTVATAQDGGYEHYYLTNDSL